MVMSNSGVRVIDPVLSSVALGYGVAALVGGNLFPRVPVRARGGKVLTFGKEAWKLYQTKRAPGGGVPRMQFGYSGASFSLNNNALDVPIPREHLQDAAQVPGIDLAARSIKTALNSVLLGIEAEQATAATTLANYPTANKITLSGGTKWSAATGDVMGTIDTGREAIRAQCGVYPNVAVCSPLAFNAAKNNPGVVERFKYNGMAGGMASGITPQMLAGLWNIDKVYVGAAIYFDDTDTAVDVWGNNVVLAYVPPDGGAIEAPSFGYTYTLDGHPLVEAPRWDGNSRSWVYGLSLECAPVISSITAGYLLQNPA